MDIIWHGNTCFTVKGSNATITINPDEQAGSLKGELVLSSLPALDVKVEGAYKVIDWPGEYEAKGVPIIGFEAHTKSKSEEKEEDLSTPTIIFYFEIDDVKFCHMAGLGHSLKSDILNAMADVDVLMIEAGGSSNLSMKKADEIIDAIDPRVLIPMGADMSELLKERGLDLVEAEKKFTIKSASELPDNERKEIKLEKI